MAQCSIQSCEILDALFVLNELFNIFEDRLDNIHNGSSSNTQQFPYKAWLLHAGYRSQAEARLFYAQCICIIFGGKQRETRKDR